MSVLKHLKTQGLGNKALVFRYQDDQGQATQTAGTLGVAVSAAESIPRLTGELLDRDLPDGVRWDKNQKFFYADMAQAGLWSKVYEAAYAFVFAKSA